MVAEASGRAQVNANFLSLLSAGGPAEIKSSATPMAIREAADLAMPAIREGKGVQLKSMGCCPEIHGLGLRGNYF